ncbi:hypothetical protein RR42_m2095 [Cupriavidus basilensis]|uniref:Uncharacterized protein n=1 Tax=Cupriavidus basilensis TaxID=68895 RepID=A0A0C4Y2T4_9BURK|nr:hypothetical protein RR42_m2095 [Cupriavidus basilensis]
MFLPRECIGLVDGGQNFPAAPGVFDADCGWQHASGAPL